MRWWLLGLLLLMGLSLGLSLLHPAQAPVGEELLQSLDKKERVRGAIEVIDAEVGDLSAIDTSQWQRGEGALPGEGLPLAAGGMGGRNRWIVAPECNFVWRSRADGGTSIDPLRASLAQEASQRVKAALTGTYQAAVEQSLADAAAAFSREGDGALFEEWFKADRTLLAEKDVLLPAVREALLLEARLTDSSVVTFDIGGPVYLLAMPGRQESDAWVQVLGYDRGRGEGRLVFAGSLRVKAVGGLRPSPERVRLLAARLGQEARASGP